MKRYPGIFHSWERMRSCWARVKRFLVLFVFSSSFYFLFFWVAPISVALDRNGNACVLLRGSFKKKLHAQNGPCRICSFNDFDCCARASWWRSKGRGRWEERGCGGRPGGLGPTAVPGDQSRSLAEGTAGRFVLENIQWLFTWDQSVEDSGPPAQGDIISGESQAHIQRKTGPCCCHLRGRSCLCAEGWCAAHRQTPYQPAATKQSEPQAEQQAQLCQH